MSTYAIGDIQGCYDELQRLLTEIQFNPAQDCLWLTGDLINRGHQSLEVLRFVKNLGKSAITVLGNHDLHFLAVACSAELPTKKDTFHDVLAAPDIDELSTWLKQQPLFYYDKNLAFSLVHAGLAPQWDLEKAQACADEVHHVLTGVDYRQFFKHMMGDTPNCWDDALQGWGRLRLITNYFTRMRYVDAKGHLDLNYKGSIGGQPSGYYPWFALPNRMTQSERVIFGHWASLKGVAEGKNIFALDTGCCWGNCLTAMRLEDQQKFQVRCGET